MPLDPEDEDSPQSSGNENDETMDYYETGPSAVETETVEHNQADVEDGDNEEDEEPDSRNGRTKIENGNTSQSQDPNTPTESISRRNTPGPSTSSAGLAQSHQRPIRPEALKSSTVYDIAPTIAAPHSTSINAIAATPDMRWVFSGGSDGWIRKFNWIDTVNSKSMLTVAQRHPFVDSVVKAGVLTSYWENEEVTDKPSLQGPEDALPLSSVYSLAVHNQALWLLSGTEGGAINLQSVRHAEGKRVISLFGHQSAVSVLSLSQDQVSVLSGSWDKMVFEWDLNVGKVKRNFGGNGGQIATIDIRPESSTAIPTIVAPSEPYAHDGFSTNDAPRQSGAKLNSNVDRELHGSVPSPNESLFGSDSLFGDTEADPSNAMGLGDDGTGEQDISLTLSNDTHQDDQLQQMDTDGDTKMHESFPNTSNTTNGQSNNVTDDIPNLITDPEIAGDLQTGELQPTSTTDETTKTDDETSQINDVNPLYSADDFDVDFFSASNGNGHETGDHQGELLVSKSESTFLTAAIDGVLRIWDRRQPMPVVHIAPPRNAPPWCTQATWSPSGDFIYVGRRNGTVDEYSVHHHSGITQPVRQLKLPGGSGAVSALKAMPNGRHLVCASHDILRLYDLWDEESARHNRVPFLIVPGHRTGVVSSLYIDHSCSFMISAGGNRGWEGTSTEVLLGYEIGFN